MTNPGRKNRKRIFFESHPYCCFCGGNEIATTEDHFPGRAIFFNRQWPEGYVFPACQKCNANSSDDELVMAVLARVNSKAEDNDLYIKEFEQALNRLQRQKPTLTNQFRTFSRNDEKKILRNYNTTPFDIYGEPRHPVKVPQEVFEHTRNFGIKLAKALHYKHTGKIIPTEGHVYANAYTNAEWKNIHTEKISAILGGQVAIERNTQPLDNQFSYRYGVTADGLASGYFISFGLGAVSFIATAYISREDYQKRKNHGLIKNLT